MEVQMFTGGMVMTNAYLVAGKVLVDAPEGVAAWLDEIGAAPEVLLLTHQHYDHVESVAELQARGVTVYGYAPYSRDLTLENFLAQVGRPKEVAPYEIDELLEKKMAAGDGTLSVGGIDFSLRHVPGHAPDSVVFCMGECVFAGDTLFAGGIGRPDLPGGDQEVLLEAIRTQLLTLPGETIIFPGHGPHTTVEREASGNHYFAQR